MASVEHSGDAKSPGEKESLLGSDLADPDSRASQADDVDHATEEQLRELVNLHRRVPLYTIIVLCLTTLFVFADQNVMAPNLTPIAREFGMTDKERDEKLGGHVSAAFFLVGAPVSLIVGYFADQFKNRPLVFSIVVFLGEIPCFCTGFVQNYTQLFWLRALTGISLGGAVPLIYSMLGDLFPAESRSIAAALVGVCMGGGILLGQMMGGLVGPQVGWRIPFIIVAVPALIMAFIVLFTVEDPPRGQQEQALMRAVASGENYAGHFTWGKAWDMLTIKTNVLVFLTSAASTIPWGAISVFANDFLSQEKGLGSENATLIVVMFGIGAAIGILGGGILGQWIYNKRRRNIAVYMTLTTFCGIIPMAIMLAFASKKLLGLHLFLGFLAGVLLSAASANAKAMVLNVNLPEVRASAFAVLNLMDDLGKGIGPLIFAAMAAEITREWAMHVSTMLFLLTALFTFFTYYTLEEDEDAVQRLVSEAQESAGGHGARPRTDSSATSDDEGLERSKKDSDVEEGGSGKGRGRGGSSGGSGSGDVDVDEEEALLSRDGPRSRSTKGDAGNQDAV